MLRELTVRDFAIVEEASLEFTPGFNALTGETGAGKSILVGALEVALGGRASEEMIRGGADQAVVEAVFSLDKTPSVTQWLKDQGMDSDGGELIIRRVLARSGRNKAFLNGAQATVAQLKTAGEALVDIHGQHESQTLINPATHLPFLDRFLRLDEERGRYKASYDKYSSARKRLRELRENQKEIERRIDLLKFQLDEVETAGLSAGEEENLERERRRLKHSEKLAELAHTAIESLDEGDETAEGLITRARAAVEQMAELDDTVKPALEELTSALAQARDAAASIRSYASGLERDPNRLEEVEDRLDLIRSLKKKYGDSVEQILSYAGRARAELESIQFDRDHMDKLAQEVEQLGGATALLAAQLDKKRKDGVGEFCRKVERELKDLNMAKAKLSLSFTYDDDPESPLAMAVRRIKLASNGAGRVEIMFSANPGEPEKPMSKIASGGEISRLMLALKAVITGDQPVPVMIFDEVDAGIGGVTADRLGEKLRALAKSCQVFCVTHLAQVARQGHTHFLVEKGTKKGKATVGVTRLDKPGRIEELARMAGGEGARESALKWAEDALNDVKG
jgi:DNA repair protein RecN (Recombination protein N)